LAAGYFILDRLWDPVLACNYPFLPLFQLGTIGSFAIILLITGMVAADLFPTGSRNRLDPVCIGLISGICTALVFTAILVSFDMVSRPPILRYVEDPFLVRMISDRLLRQWLIPFAGFLTMSGIVQALAAWYRGSRQDGGDTKDGSPRRSAITGIVSRYRIPFFILIAVIVVPPGLLYLGMNTGIIAEKPMCSAITGRVNVTRTGPDSIRIVMEPDPKKRCDSVMDIKIFLDKNEVSSQSLINRSGLDDRIDPSAGLLYRSGASVTLRGKDVAGNETVPTHIRILVSCPDTNTGAVICDRDI